MVFSSAIFLFAFLPIVFLIERLLPGRRTKNVFLALASIVFYAFGQLNYVPLFLLSVAANYLFGVLLQEGDTQKPEIVANGPDHGVAQSECGALQSENGVQRYSCACRKVILICAVAVNLGVLGVFKYLDFAVQNLNVLCGASVPLPGIVLPIGISFFTFQGLSYVIDVYRDPESGTRSFGKVLLYIAFFPQLIAGPIVKYHDISEQIDARQTTPEQTAAGIRRFVLGLGKKVLIANTAGAVADTVFTQLSASAALPAWAAWLGAVSYMLQIYYDFSGYSDMAIGIGHIFGFTFAENFDHPYGAASIREFWRRWHISLSAWFREYLYIPLGGNRKGKKRAALNRLIVFLATGVWHGANWTFILWGACHGILSSLEDCGVIPVEKLRRKGVLGRGIAKAYTLLAVLLLFVVFRADTVAQAGTMIVAMFPASLWNASAVSSAGSALRFSELCPPATAVALVLGILFAGHLSEIIARFVRKCPNGVRTGCEVLRTCGSVCIFVLSVASLARGGFNPFIYFQF